MDIYKFIYLTQIKCKVAFSLGWEILEKKRVGLKVSARFVSCVLRVRDVGGGGVNLAFERRKEKEWVSAVALGDWQ